uniref:Uncharacterized protein n=1 Tax=Glossina palpalis gambiensis TaxID=67801 RepID=A0A1B0AVP5_9MUSC
MSNFWFDRIFGIAIVCDSRPCLLGQTPWIFTLSNLYNENAAVKSFKRTYGYVAHDVNKRTTLARPRPAQER